VTSVEASTGCGPKQPVSKAVHASAETISSRVLVIIAPKALERVHQAYQILITILPILSDAVPRLRGEVALRR